ncbi:hypothetical protein CEUSTIGMA_g5827.t1 [Chlamydomonas eustigma]|uniref:Protein kinase domain-containing protein n=1 Tax=Chlamydomonas eustigma TaxID=1157962 RepID=A0A250X5N1_9CHLO|nr:hypothetical protein CEUSTIGMA_g5827.t1 [Chlamydomonas eustigma]|eukprot:GAX78385.1 hypothetical protein CEUSTIGMA_g5827.t1 [Chlamydomonas eustigma]
MYRKPLLVAIKTIKLPREGEGPDGIAVASLKKEIAVLVKATQHCHYVCRYHGVSRKDNCFCLVMAKYPKSLADHIADYPGGKLPLVAALAIGRDILTGLKEIHHLGIVMLDLKPDNVLMTIHGTAVLTDFGISKVVSGTIGMVQQTQMAGTMNYMAPEQMEEGTNVGPAADVWAFGCTLIHMITGVPPLSTLNMMQIIRKVSVMQQIPDIPADIPSSMARLLLSCFAHSPYDRPSVGQLAEEMLAVSVLDLQSSVASVASTPLLDQQSSVASVASTPLLDQQSSVASVASTPLLDQQSSVASVASTPLLDQQSSVASVASTPSCSSSSCDPAPSAPSYSFVASPSAAPVPAPHQAPVPQQASAVPLQTHQAPPHAPLYHQAPPHIPLYQPYSNSQAANSFHHHYEHASAPSAPLQQHDDCPPQPYQYNVPPSPPQPYQYNMPPSPPQPYQYNVPPSPHQLQLQPQLQAQLAPISQPAYLGQHLSSQGSMMAAPSPQPVLHSQSQPQPQLQPVIAQQQTQLHLAPLPLVMTGPAASPQQPMEGSVSLSASSMVSVMQLPSQSLADASGFSSHSMPVAHSQPENQAVQLMSASLQHNPPSHSQPQQSVPVKTAVISKDVLDAAKNGDSEILSIMLQRPGANVDMKSFWGNKSALMLAAKGGYTECVALLLAKGANVKANDSDGYTALTYAAEGGHKECLALLLEKGSYIHHKTTTKDSTALMIAAKGNFKECVALLLEKGADPKDKDKPLGRTALMKACKNGHKECVAMLLSKRADPNIRDKKFQTALINAVENGHKSCVELLLEKGAQTNLQDKRGQSALMKAIEYGSKDIVKMLLDKGADMNAMSMVGMSALSYAWGKPEMEELLNKSKLSVNRNRAASAGGAQ